MNFYGKSNYVSGRHLSDLHLFIVTISSNIQNFIFAPALAYFGVKLSNTIDHLQP
jgi:hypothetical protein